MSPSRLPRPSESTRAQATRRTPATWSGARPEAEQQEEEAVRLEEAKKTRFYEGLADHYRDRLDFYGLKRLV